MSTHPASRKHWMRPGGHSWLRWCLVWLLCLCTWRGPVPVVHCHSVEALGQSDVGSKWHLAEHISVCHAGEREIGETGWHVHFILPPAGGSKVPHDLPVDRPILAELITHDADARHATASAAAAFDRLVTNQASQVLTDLWSPFHQPVLKPSTPRLIPLAPPRNPPGRVPPRIYFCVAQC